jgi:hypothetical protein
MECNKASGGEPFLRPINSIELRHPLSNSNILSLHASLTPTNQECLVFVSCIYELSLDDEWYVVPIIFTGDSPMGSGTNYANSFLKCAEFDRPIITAPHHGSNSNEVAYKNLSNRQSPYNDGLWIRAGGNKRHPGITYNKISVENRKCTHCPSKNQKPMPVIIALDDISFYPILGNQCTCTQEQAAIQNSR